MHNIQMFMTDDGFVIDVDVVAVIVVVVVVDVDSCALPSFRIYN